MPKEQRYREFLDSLRDSEETWNRYALMQFAIAVRRLMKLEPVKGATLAKRLKKSAGVVSKQLTGGENLTVETMTKIAGALDAAVYIHVAKKGVRVDWRETPMTQATDLGESASQDQPVTLPVDWLSKFATAQFPEVRYEIRPT
jgi:transcriptional regulator with XRE-family HTH domain